MPRPHTPDAWREPRAVAPRFAPPPLVLAVAVLAGCATGPHPVATAAPADEARDYLVIEYPLGRTTRVEETGEQEVLVALRHDKGETELAAEAEYGIADRVQLDVEVPYAWFHGAGSGDDGIPAIRFGGRIAALEDPHDVAVTVGAEITAPIEDSRTDYTVFGVVGKRLEDLQLNGSYGLRWDGDRTRQLWTLSAATPWRGALPDVDLFPTLEVFGQGSASWIAPGVVWPVQPQTELSLAVPFGLGGDSESVGIALGFLVEW